MRSRGLLIRGEFYSNDRTSVKKEALVGHIDDLDEMTNNLPPNTPIKEIVDIGLATGDSAVSKSVVNKASETKEK